MVEQLLAVNEGGDVSCTLQAITKRLSAVNHYPDTNFTSA